MTAAEKRLQDIAKMAAEMPENALRAIFAEILLSDGEKFEEIYKHRNEVLAHFADRWTDFQEYGKGGCFDA